MLALGVGSGQLSWAFDVFEPHVRGRGDGGHDGGRADGRGGDGHVDDRVFLLRCDIHPKIHLGLHTAPNKAHTSRPKPKSISPCCPASSKNEMKRNSNRTKKQPHEKATARKKGNVCSQVWFVTDKMNVANPLSLVHC